ncbi:MAG: M28 family peptidase [candidate division WOR-3 bacterium]
MNRQSNRQQEIKQLIGCVEMMNTNIKRRQEQINRQLGRDIIEQNNSFLLVFRKNHRKVKDTILISTHIDSVFENNEFVLKFDPNGGITGTLDNCITNGVALNLLVNGYLDNFFVGFTNYEESGMLGAQGLAKYIKKHKLPVKLIVTLDVTNDNWNADISIENVFSNNGDFYALFIEMLRELGGANFNCGVKQNADPDESHKYQHYGFSVFSACLPTQKNMHSVQCFTTCDKLYQYQEALKVVLNTMYNSYCGGK